VARRGFRLNRHTALATLCSLAATGGLGAVSEAQASQALHLAAPPTEDMTNTYYGIKNGTFQRAGLDLDFYPTSSGSAAVTAMLTGSYDIAVSGLPSLLLAHLRDLPLVIIMGENAHNQRNPSQLLQVATDSKIQNAADLNGKIIGTPSLNDLNSVAIRAWTDKNGGDWRSLKFVEAPNSALVAAIAEHRIDAGSVQYPALGISLADKTTRTIGDALSAIAPRFLEAAYIARRDWVSQNAATVQRFRSAYTEATNYTNGHFPQTASYTAELTGITLDQALKMRRTANPTTATPGQIQPLIDAAAKYGAISKSFKAEELL
jgi:NitT/TauT family transport system substrate-binding protein